ncbi:hypothetical protein MES5069_90077 [Mesorhizobium escarrei]|uniref:Uncharacterized protein n=1 Tax=Mesorhizobium escarrei TaxID=666018 RepID=A0ABM9EJJ1_9HYPH|nr:hypothetical protein MES5069_90077 [Mesorhizobium escarrei]
MRRPCVAPKRLIFPACDARQAGKSSPLAAHPGRSGSVSLAEYLFQKAFFRSLMMKIAHDSFAGSSYFSHRR